MQRWFVGLRFPIFQSSLPRGERRCKGGSLDSDSRYFNPRSHEGSDYEGKWYWYSVVYISILAPTRGATLRQICVWLVLLFQSSLPRGERPSIFDTSEEIKEFQSSLPRGERPCCNRDSVDLTVFQSSLPRGERRCFHDDYKTFSKFQSSLPRGERPQHRKIVCYYK